MQLRIRERLQDVVVGAAFEPTEPSEFAGPAGEDEDRQVGVGAVGDPVGSADVTDELEAVAVRQAEVDDRDDRGTPSRSDRARRRRSRPRAPRSRRRRGCRRETFGWGRDPRRGGSWRERHPYPPEAPAADDFAPSAMQHRIQPLRPGRIPPYDADAACTDAATTARAKTSSWSMANCGSRSTNVISASAVSRPRASLGS